MGQFVFPDLSYSENLWESFLVRCALVGKRAEENIEQLDRHVPARWVVYKTSLADYEKVFAERSFEGRS